jgi:hypothetical protein
VIVDVVGAGAELSVTVAVWLEETTFSRIVRIKTGDETAQDSADDAFAAISSKATSVESISGTNSSGCQWCL